MKKYRVLHYLSFCILLIAALGLCLACNGSGSAELGPTLQPLPSETPLPIVIEAIPTPAPTPEPTEAPTEAPPTLPPTITLFGREFDTSAETINLDGVPMENTDALFDALRYFPTLTRVEMDNTGLSDDQIGELTYAFPQIRFVWTIQLRYTRYKLKTDVTAYTTYVAPAAGYPRLTSADVESLKYCTDLMALDLGHNSISDLSFLEPLKKLEILILCDNRVSDISVLESLKELSYIELMMNKVTDVSALATLPKLQDLHLGSNLISDFSPLYTCSQLQRLWVPSQFGNTFPKDSRAALEENLPDCTFMFNYEKGDGDNHIWRTHPRYDWMKAIFRAGTVAPKVKG